MLLALLLLLPLARAAFAADGPPPNDDGKQRPHDCDHRQEQQTS
jgi:hypothetical protein